MSRRPLSGPACRAPEGRIAETELSAQNLGKRALIRRLGAPGRRPVSCKSRATRSKPAAVPSSSGCDRTRSRRGLPSPPLRLSWWKGLSPVSEQGRHVSHVHRLTRTVYVDKVPARLPEPSQNTSPRGGPCPSRGNRRYSLWSKLCPA